MVGQCRARSKLPPPPPLALLPVLMHLATADALNSSSSSSSWAPFLGVFLLLIAAFAIVSQCAWLFSTDNNEDAKAANEARAPSQPPPTALKMEPKTQMSTVSTSFKVVPSSKVSTKMSAKMPSKVSAKVAHSKTFTSRVGVLKVKAPLGGRRPLLGKYGTAQEKSKSDSASTGHNPLMAALTNVRVKSISIYMGPKKAPE